MRYLWETNKDLINQLQRDSKLFHSPIHGFKHWRTVEGMDCTFLKMMATQWSFHSLHTSMIV